MEDKKPFDPVLIFEQYNSGVTYKNSLGNRGMYEQNKVNERFYVGDQWHGAKCGNLPLVRHNVIKRIGEYKISIIGASPVSVNYTAEGIPNTLELKKRVQKVRSDMVARQSADPFMDIGEPPAGDVETGEEVALVMSAMSDYWRVTAERVKLDDLKTRVLKKAYKTGTGLLYTYWDDSIRTGLYADNARKTAISGDIACEVLDVENVYFGDPAELDVQKQPYILLVQRKSVKELRRIARRNHRPAQEIENIRPDNHTQYMAGEMSEKELTDAQKAVTITKLWKEWNDDGTKFTIKAVQVVKGATIRKEWDLGLRLYPLAKFVWEERDNCAYGESEVTYLIPNQIAINRMLSANVWALIMMGMPIMVVNGDVLQQPLTNDPGQIVKVYGMTEDVLHAINYVRPPDFSPQFDNNTNNLIQNTLTTAGANDAALGDMRPDNMSAIIAVREAATMPLQVTQSRFWSFCEDIARIWAEFWVMKYGSRSLKVEDERGTWYVPFNGERYKDFLISCKIDVGASTLWSEAGAIRTLDNLFDRGVIDVQQYLERMPNGMIKDLNGLIRELEERATAQPPQSPPTTPQDPVLQSTASPAPAMPPMM